MKYFTIEEMTKSSTAKANGIEDVYKRQDKIC